ncbi:MAG: hypothetical protein ABW136_11195 [Steroidobacteraceae bacterium]
MKTFKTAILAGVTAVLAATAVGAQETREKADKLLDQAKGAVTPGEVVLTGTDTKTLHDSRTSSTYNVCVKQDKEAGSVRIMNDAKTTTLKPGQCEHVMGMKITATPAMALTGTARSTVTFEKHGDK